MQNSVASFSFSTPPPPSLYARCVETLGTCKRSTRHTRFSHRRADIHYEFAASQQRPGKSLSLCLFPRGDNRASTSRARAANTVVGRQSNFNLDPSNRRFPRYNTLEQAILSINTTIPSPSRVFTSPSAFRRRARAYRQRDAGLYFARATGGRSFASFRYPLRVSSPGVKIPRQPLRGQGESLPERRHVFRFFLAALHNPAPPVSLPSHALRRVFTLFYLIPREIEFFGSSGGNGGLRHENLTHRAEYY